jgi:hypothetical protein
MELRKLNREQEKSGVLSLGGSWDEFIGNHCGAEQCAGGGIGVSHGRERTNQRPVAPHQSPSYNRGDLGERNGKQDKKR